VANNEHLHVIRQGVGAWNAWRANILVGKPDLTAARLVGFYLKGADLYETHLVEADLSGAVLSDANLREADLRNAFLVSADLSLANLHNANLTGVNLNGANLRHANLRQANLSYVHAEKGDFRDAALNEANLKEADLEEADLRGADLTGTDLSSTNLTGTDLRGTTLDEANLSGAMLIGTMLRNASLKGADLSHSHIANTTFGNNDLSSVKGLGTVNHRGPSTIGVDTLYKSDGTIPEVFLRGVGIPEDLITFLPSLLVGRAIEFYSSFISYSHQDEQFSQRLYWRMRSEKLRVWFATEDMRAGKKLHEQVFSAIQIHDKLLLVLSENSMKSEWVKTEIRRPRKVEREENRRKLFPIRLVDFEPIQKWECFDADSGKDLAIELREYYIPDFSNWKDHETFESEFTKLLRDLKADEA
jgi:uncharacterized protein YjbI with pentapeptide repeats